MFTECSLNDHYMFTAVPFDDPEHLDEIWRRHQNAKLRGKGIHRRTRPFTKEGIQSKSFDDPGNEEGTAPSSPATRKEVAHSPLSQTGLYYSSSSPSNTPPAKPLSSSRPPSVPPTPTSSAGNAKAVDPTAVDPTAVDPTAVYPTAVDPKAVDPKAVNPKAVDPKAVDLKDVNPKAVNPNAVNPKAVDPKASNSDG
jgi:ribonuclease E